MWWQPLNRFYIKKIDSMSCSAISAMTCWKNNFFLLSLSTQFRHFNRCISIQWYTCKVMNELGGQFYFFPFPFDARRIFRLFGLLCINADDDVYDRIRWSCLLIKRLQRKSDNTIGPNTSRSCHAEMRRHSCNSLWNLRMWIALIPGA